MKAAFACVIIACLSSWARADEKPSSPPAGMASSQPASLPKDSPDTASTAVASTSTLSAPLAPAEPATTLAVIQPRSLENTHRFFDLKNSAALATVAAGLTGDALSTQKGLGLPGFHEMNPIARPFVQNRPGAVVYNAASFALMGGSMFVAHRTNHHKLERILPFAVAGWEGFLTYRNYHLISSSTKTR